MAVNIGPKIGIDGEAKFRKELQGIIQQTKTYAAETDAVTAAVGKETDKEAANEKVKESLAKQLKAQEELVKKLQEGVENAAKATGEDSEKTNKWKEQLAKATAELYRLQGQTDQTTGEIGDYAAETEDASKKTSIFGDVLKANLASEVVKKGLQITKDLVKNIGSELTDAVKSAAAYGDEIKTLSIKTGLATDTLQEYRYMEQLVDVDLNTITGSLTKLTRNMESARGGTGAAAEAFEKLGVSVKDENGNLRDNEAVFDETIERLGQIKNETERDAIAMQIFGKSAQDLNPLILAGADGLAQLRKEARDTGSVLSKETLNTLNDVEDEFARLGNTWESIKRQFGARIGKKLLPDMKDVTKTLQSFAKTGNYDNLFDGLSKSAEKALKKLPKIGDKILTALPKLIKKIGNWFGGTGGKQLGNSIGDGIGKKFRNLPKLIEAGLTLGKNLIKGVLTAIPEMVKGIAEGLTAPRLTEAAQEAIENFNNVRDALTDIPEATERTADALSEIAAKSKEGDRWIEVFDELSKLTDPTAEQTERLQQAVDKLNELYPELGLVLDEETGKWNLNTEEIRSNIKALQARYKTEAYYKAASETQVDIAKLEIESEKYREQERALKEQITTLGEKQIALQKQRDALDGIGQLVTAGAISEVEAAKRLRELGIEVKNTGDVYAIAETEFKATNDALAETERQITELVPEWQATAKTVKEYDKKIEELNRDVEYFYGKAAEEAENALETEQQALKETADAAEDAADRIKDSAETVSGLNWKLDLPNGKTIWQQGKDISENLLKGYMYGFEKYKQPAIAEGRNFITSAVNAMREEAQIKSPSKLTEDLIGKNLALGVIKGWDDIINPVALEQKQVFSLTPAFDAMLRGGDTVSNVTNTQNLGGVSINVYAADGQDANAIADAIMIKIQRAANARKAVFA